MITVHFEKTKKGELLLSVLGHAKSKPQGEDLICASASVLLYTIAQRVNDWEESGYMNQKPIIDIQKGDSTILCCPKKKSMRSVAQDFGCIMRGFDILAFHYPQYVKIE